MKKQTLTLLLALAMIFSLAGCGGSTAVTASTTPSAQPETTATAVVTSAAPNTEVSTETQPAETVSLPLTDSDTVFTDFETIAPPLAPYMKNGWNDNASLQELAKRTGVKINYVSVNATESSTKFQLMIASGDYTDIIGGFSNYDSNTDKAIEQGIIIDLSDLISQYAPNIKKQIDSNDSIRKAFTTDTGNVPLVKMLSNGLSNASYGPVIRQDWLDAAGMTAPVTYDDWYKVLTAFKNNGHSNALLLGVNGTPSNDFLVGGYGIAGTLNTVPFTTVPLYQVNGTVKLGFMEPEYKTYLTMLNKWYSEGLINTDFYSQSGMNPSDDLVGNGKIGLWFSDVAEFSAYQTKGSDGNASFAIAALTDPVQNVGDKIHLSENYDYASQGNAISTACKNPALIMQYYNYLFSDEGAKLCQYGIENQSYTVNAEGKIQYTDLITNNPDGMAPRMALLKYATFTYFSDPSALDLVYTADEIAAYKTYDSNRDADYRISAAVTLTTDESEAYSSKMGDITTYCAESIVQFITGEKSMDEFDAFITQLKSIGIQDCIDIQQAAYDRYLKR